MSPTVLTVANAFTTTFDFPNGFVRSFPPLSPQVPIPKSVNEHSRLDRDSPNVLLFPSFLKPDSFFCWRFSNFRMREIEELLLLVVKGGDILPFLPYYKPEQGKQIFAFKISPFPRPATQAIKDFFYAGRGNT